MRDERDSGSVRWRRVRLGLYLAAIATLSTIFLARRVEAELSERAFSLGRQLDRMSTIAAGTTTFEVNGARMSLTTITREESIPVLLERFAGLCARDSGGVSEQLDELGDKVPDGLRRGQFGVFRDEREHEGVAACFARQDGGGLEETARRVQLLAETGDFASLGQLRFLWARDLGNGASHVLSVSSLGALPLDRMFPESGDAPGKDLSFGVRPAGARRLISAHVEGGKLEGALYESKLAPAQALAGYDAPMRELGFARGHLGAVPAEYVEGARVFLRQDETVLVFAQPHETSTTVSSFRLANGGFVSVKMP
jgi:hypothetical protein